MKTLELTSDQIDIIIGGLYHSISKADNEEEKEEIRILKRSIVSQMFAQMNKK